MTEPPVIEHDPHEKRETNAVWWFRIAGALALLAVAGCQSDRSQVAQQEWNHCSANGTEKNLDKINVCLSNYSRVQNAQQQQANARSDAMMAASIALLSQGNQAPAIQPPPMPQRTYCTSQYNAFLRQVQTYCR